MHVPRVAVAILIVLACSSTPGTKMTLDKYVGRPISAFIDHHGYPVEQPIDLPGGTRSYHFVNGNGAFLEGRSGAWSHPCHVWLEVDQAGNIMKYRFEGCD
jgi:hypothetical protein